MQICPLVFEPRFVPKVWGGRRLSAFGKALPPEAAIGESWELFDDEKGSAVVAAGPAKGLSLRQLSQEWGAALVGPGHEAWAARFPLLIKLLDAREDLSVQVHPDDALAARLEGPGTLGKSEMWVVVGREPGARLLSGFKPGVDAVRLRRGLADGTAMQLMQELSVEPGDVVDIPAGRVHAIGAGCLIAEVQQNSDVTYRVWDYGRLENGKPRALHVEQALQALRFDQPFCSASGKAAPQARREGTAAVEDLVRGPYFDVRRLRLSGPHSYAAGRLAPEVLMALEGGLRLNWEGGAMDVPAGATALLPASLAVAVAPLGAAALLLSIRP